MYHLNIFCTDPVIISDGGKVENQSIVNDFNNDDILELMCRSDNMFDVVEWIMINQTGTVQKHITNTSNVSSTLTFSNPSDDFTSQMRCTSNNIAHIDVFITKGNNSSTINLRVTAIKSCETRYMRYMNDSNC